MLVVTIKAVRSITRSCFVSRRRSAKPNPQLMGQLPKERITPDAVFNNVGLDYVGPIYIKRGSTRKPTIVTDDRWHKLIRHVRDKVEDHHWTSDGLYEQTIRPFVINFRSDSDSDTASSDDSDSDHDGGTSDEDPDCDSDDCVCSCED